MTRIFWTLLRVNKWNLLLPAREIVLLACNNATFVKTAAKLEHFNLHYNDILFQEWNNNIILHSVQGVQPMVCVLSIHGTVHMNGNFKLVNIRHSYRILQKAPQQWHHGRKKKTLDNFWFKERMHEPCCSDKEKVKVAINFDDLYHKLYTKHVG